MHKSHNNFTRKALLSALTVAAITGVSVADAFAASENMSMSSAHEYTLQSGSKTGNIMGDPNGLRVTVGNTEAPGQKVGITGVVNFTGALPTNQYSIMVQNGSSVYIGQKFVTAPAGQTEKLDPMKGAVVTADNVSVTGGSTLDVHYSTLTVKGDLLLNDATMNAVVSTVTADNMSMTDSELNLDRSTLNVAKDVVVNHSQINMYGANINIGADGAGKLTLENKSALNAVGGENTVNASVVATEGSQVTVGVKETTTVGESTVTVKDGVADTAASLNITGALTLDNSHVVINGTKSSLTVGGGIVVVDAASSATPSSITMTGGTITTKAQSLADNIGTAGGNVFGTITPGATPTDPETITTSATLTEVAKLIVKDGNSGTIFANLDALTFTADSFRTFEALVDNYATSLGVAGLTADSFKTGLSGSGLQTTAANPLTDAALNGSAFEHTGTNDLFFEPTVNPADNTQGTIASDLYLTNVVLTVVNTAPGAVPITSLAVGNGSAVMGTVNSAGAAISDLAVSGTYTYGANLQTLTVNSAGVGGAAATVLGTTAGDWRTVGTVNVADDDSALFVNNVTITTLAGLGDAFFGNMTTGSNALVGNVAGAAGVVGVDPAWGTANSYLQITGAAPGTAVDINANSADYVAGMNSILVFDDTATSTEQYWEGLTATAGSVTQANLTQSLAIDGFTSVLGIAETVSLTAGGSLWVNGDWQSTSAADVATAAALTDRVLLGENSLLAVNGADFTFNTAVNNVVITSAAPLTFDLTTTATARPTLALDNMFVGSLTLVQNATVSENGVAVANENAALRDSTNLVISNLDYGLSTSLSKGNAGNADIVATTGVDSRFDDADDLLAGWYNQAYHTTTIQPLINAGNAVGVNYVNRLLDPVTYIANGYTLESGRSQSANDLNSALRAATLSGPIASFMAVSASSAALDMRNSLVGGEGVAMVALEEGSNEWTGMSAGSGMRNGVGLWITPLYKAANAWGMDAGDEFETGYNASLGGVAIGGDFTFNDAFRVGLTFNVGAGYASSNGDLADTHNNFNFWGLGLYAGYYQENFGITADFGYTGTYNSIDQDAVRGAGGFGGIETDTTSGAFTVGVRGEYKIATDALDITPHVGVRYTGVQTYGYDLEVNGGDAFEGDSFYQGVWTFPIGVTFSKAIETSGGWTFTPSLDLAIIPAAGDLDVEADVNIAGLGIGTTTNTQVVDGFSYQGAVGFDFGDENVTFGLDYTLTGSQHTTNHGLQATFRYEF